MLVFGNDYEYIKKIKKKCKWYLYEDQEEKMLKCEESKKGITLIALIITVIVMLILAGVSLNALVRR